MVSSFFDEIIAFRGCTGDPKGDPEKTCCIWIGQTCARCERIAPAHYWENKGTWVQWRMEHPHGDNRQMKG